jgi:hypothetical protein
MDGYNDEERSMFEEILKEEMAKYPNLKRDNEENDKKMFDEMVKAEMEKMEREFAQKLKTEENSPSSNINKKHVSYDESEMNDDYVPSFPRNNASKSNRKQEIDEQVSVGNPLSPVGNNMKSNFGGRIDHNMNDNYPNKPRNNNFNSGGSVDIYQSKVPYKKHSDTSSNDQKRIQQQKYQELLENDRIASLNNQQKNLDREKRNNRNDEINIGKNNSSSLVFGNNEDMKEKKAKQLLYHCQLAKQVNHNPIPASSSSTVDRSSKGNDNNNTSLQNNTYRREDEADNAASLKKQNQRKYFEELSQSSTSHPIMEERVSLRSQRMNKTKHELAGYSSEIVNESHSKTSSAFFVGSGLNSVDQERKLKRDKQQEYFNQLTQSSAMNEIPKEKVIHNSLRERNISSPVQDQSIFQSQKPPEMTALEMKRLAQHDYKKQLDEAANQQPITSPRVSRRPRRNLSPEPSRGNQNSNSPGLLFAKGLSTIGPTTSINKKKASQQSYFDSLKQDSASLPIQSTRVSRSRHVSPPNQSTGLIIGERPFSEPMQFRNRSADLLMDKKQKQKQKQREYAMLLQNDSRQPPIDVPRQPISDRGIYESTKEEEQQGKNNNYPPPPDNNETTSRRDEEEYSQQRNLNIYRDDNKISSSYQNDNEVDTTDGGEAALAAYRQRKRDEMLKLQEEKLRYALLREQEQEEYHQNQQYDKYKKDFEAQQNSYNEQQDYIQQQQQPNKSPNHNQSVSSEIPYDAEYERSLHERALELYQAQREKEYSQLSSYHTRGTSSGGGLSQWNHNE